MTLILTCATQHYIVQIADRRLTRLDGKLHDDDTNKAVFACGRHALAYTGPAFFGTTPTAEWIAITVKDARTVSEAMETVAARAEPLLNNPLNRRFAVVATGYVFDYNAAYISIASNFMTDNWDWSDSAYEPMRVRTKYLPKEAAFTVVAAGQQLSWPETVWLNRHLRRALQHGPVPNALVTILASAVQHVARADDHRKGLVGRGMIIQRLCRAAIRRGVAAPIVTPLTPDMHSFLYVSRDGRTDEFQGAVVSCGGGVLTDVGGQFLAPGAKGKLETEIEDEARRMPLRVPAAATEYVALCPHCESEIRKGMTPVSHIVSGHRPISGELPLGQDEAWIHCGGNTGHLVLVQRERS